MIFQFMQIDCIEHIGNEDVDHIIFLLFRTLILGLLFIPLDLLLILL